MKALGIDGHLGQWLGSFLVNRTQSVKIGDVKSKKVTIQSGVPQKSVLGPIMFLIFIADIRISSDADAYIYVDDSKISKKIQNENDVEIFQSCLNDYYRWAALNNMKFNDSKFVSLRYGKNMELKYDTKYFTSDMNLPIDELDTHKDLGILMSSDGSFKIHIENIIKKSERKSDGYVDHSMIEVRSL